MEFGLNERTLAKLDEVKGTIEKFGNSFAEIGKEMNANLKRLNNNLEFIDKSFLLKTKKNEKRK